MIDVNEIEVEIEKESNEFYDPEDDEVEYYYYVTLKFGTYISMTFTDCEFSNLVFYEKLWEAIQTYGSYGGTQGGNSYSGIEYETDKLTLSAEVSGSGGDFTMKCNFNESEALILVDKIICAIKNAM